MGRDPKSDLAVVKVDAKNLPAIEIADSDHVEVGDLVLATGHLKLQVADTKPGDTVRVAILRDGHARSFTVKVGELPGEPSMLKASHDAAGKSDTLHGVGVMDLSAKERREYSVPEAIQGAMISSVESDSAAAKAGLKPGDVILEIDRQKVKNAKDAVRLTEHAADRVTLVRVWSKGGVHYVVVDETMHKPA